MTPAFAQSVDPIFLYVLQLLERISQNRPAEVEEVRRQVQKRIDDAEMSLHNSPQWQLAKYAIVCWIDSMLIHAPWPGNNWWENNPLERAYFHGRDAYTLFYAKAKEAANLPSKDALEVFYLCVVLGFRGFYEASTSAQFAAQLGLPPRIEDWTQQSGASIQIGLGRPVVEAAPQVGDGAPPLEGRSQLAVMSVFAVLSLAALAAYFVIFIWAPNG